MFLFKLNLAEAIESFKIFEPITHLFPNEYLNELNSIIRKNYKISLF